MWSRLYRNYVIVAFPTYDTVTNSWAPQADINWFAGFLMIRSLSSSPSAAGPKKKR